MVVADLLGPLGGPDEEFRKDPIDRYLLGRLAPSGVSIDPDNQDELSEAGASDIVEGDTEPSEPSVPSLAPSALGFTACVDGAETALRVSAGWGVLSTVAAPRVEADLRSVEAGLITARPGHLIATPARRLVSAWWSGARDLPGGAVALALRSAAEVHARATARRSELVISGPTSDHLPGRLTNSVVVEVIRAARESLLVVSFAAYRVPDVVAELAAAADRNVRVDLVLESSAAEGGGLRRGSGAAAFGRLRDRATFWHWPADQRRAGGSPGAALHAKLIAADTRIALVSSANLTDRALSDNLEVGVVLRDPDLVRRLVGHFAGLMDPRTGPLRTAR